MLYLNQNIVQVDLPELNKVLFDAAHSEAPVTIRNTSLFYLNSVSLMLAMAIMVEVTHMNPGLRFYRLLNSCLRVK